MTRTDDVASCYDPAFEHDSCGVAFVVDLERPASHRVVSLGLTALENLAHRGAFGADPGTGDGAGRWCRCRTASIRRSQGSISLSRVLRHRDGVPPPRAASC